MLLPLTVVVYHFEVKGKLKLSAYRCLSVCLSGDVSDMRKLVCDFLLVNNTNLPPIPRRYQVIAGLLVTFLLLTDGTAF